MDRNEFLFAGLAMVLVAAASGTLAYIIAPDQGSTAAPNANGTILLTGDTPRDEQIPLPDIFRLKQSDVLTFKARYGVGVPEKGVPLLTLLNAYGMSDFDRLVLYADDYELTINRSDVTGETILVPYGDTIRILGSNLPVNAGVKNIKSGINTMVYSRLSSGYVTDNHEYTVETGYVAMGISLRDFLFKEGFSNFSHVMVGSGSSRPRIRTCLTG